MLNRRLIATLFMLIAFLLGIRFYRELHFPIEIQPYLRLGFYRQFGTLTLCVELFAAGINLFIRHPKTKFVLALFAFTALLDPFFNAIGFFNNTTPLYATLLFVACALVSLWLVYGKKFELGSFSTLQAVGTFLLGVLVELFFNAW